MNDLNQMYRATVILGRIIVEDGMEEKIDPISVIPLLQHVAQANENYCKVIEEK